LDADVLEKVIGKIANQQHVAPTPPPPHHPVEKHTAHRSDRVEERPAAASVARAGRLVWK
jgi:hypothetical protein